MRTCNAYGYFGPKMLIHSDTSLPDGHATAPLKQTSLTVTLGKPNPIE